MHVGQESHVGDVERVISKNGMISLDRIGPINLSRFDIMVIEAEGILSMAGKIRTTDAGSHVNGIVKVLERRRCDLPFAFVRQMIPRTTVSLRIETIKKRS